MTTENGRYLTLRLPLDLHDRVKAAADFHGIVTTQWVRMAIAHMLRHSEDDTGKAKA